MTRIWEHGQTFMPHRRGTKALAVVTVVLATVTVLLAPMPAALAAVPLDVTVYVYDKVYDGTDAATVSVCVVDPTGVAAGDMVSCDLGSLSATFEDANVGTDKDINASVTLALGAGNSGGPYEVGNIDAVPADITAPNTSIVYGGQTYIVTAGTSPANLSATLTTDSTACALGTVGSAIAFEVRDIEGDAVSGSPFPGSESGDTATATTGALPTGLYTITARSTSTDVNCPSASDSAVLAIVSASGAVTGSGWYRAGYFGGYGSSRANFGLVLNKTYSGTGRNKTWTGFKGQFLWLSSEGWRIKTDITGDTELVGTFGCPGGVGVTGSNPVCGRFAYAGVLQTWDPDAGPDGDWVYRDDVTFTVTFYDGGSVTVCKKRTCTRTDIADAFGIDVDEWSTLYLPESVPVTLVPPGGKGSVKAALA